MNTTVLFGQDALLIVQMRLWIPVATVAIDNATNAGLLAARIIGAGDRDVFEHRLQSYSDNLKSTSWRRDYPPRVASLQVREECRPYTLKHSFQLSFQAVQGADSGRCRAISTPSSCLRHRSALLTPADSDTSRLRSAQQPPDRGLQ